MLRKTHKQYASLLKAKIVVEALRKTKTISELAAEHQIHPNQITKGSNRRSRICPLFVNGVAKDETILAQEATIAEHCQ